MITLDVPNDPRIANRPDNPNWHGVRDWFDQAAKGIEMTTRNDTHGPDARHLLDTQPTPTDIRNTAGRVRAEQLEAQSDHAQVHIMTAEISRLTRELREMTFSNNDMISERDAARQDADDLYQSLQNLHRYYSDPDFAIEQNNTAFDATDGNVTYQEAIHEQAATALAAHAQQVAK